MKDNGGSRIKRYTVVISILSRIRSIFRTNMSILKHSACDSVNLKYLEPLTAKIRLYFHSVTAGVKTATKEHKYKSIHADIVLD